MARCYSALMRPCQPLSPLPRIWLISDARNDGMLDRALRRMPRGSGLIYRHYHLPQAERRARFKALARIARGRGMAVVLAGDAAMARRWGADGAYGAGQALATAHNLRELRQARGAAGVLLSPVFPTRSHPGAPVLGAVRFRLLAARSSVPVIALGGMNRARAGTLKWPRWAAIDGLSPTH
ncbi:thiamine phosphate synthase [Novosphingobium sediminicola]|uniref:Thiamine-phosphate pyrophosphorylase n=1 Tax=Novosphingobium sediminicola TaxID=563162 RepID=A0A7W6CNG0_9SPHN|nr:thiamine phosphate synthase [Novosphingobium sediminicola]MBB3956990.1 thiamine-phosphate pyrophosphorylase [Novosphingobium sediminicola]